MSDQRIQTDELLAPYQPHWRELAQLEADNAGLAFAYDTPEGEKEARSHIYSLRRKKGDVERVRKELKSHALEYGRKVDSAAREITDRLDKMIAVHQEPLDQIAEAERQRKAQIAEALDAYRVPRRELGELASSQQYTAAVIKLSDKFPTNEEFQEQIAEAVAIRQAELLELRALLDLAMKREAEAEELERLRAEAEARAKRDAEERAARERQEREARIAQQAAERAKLEAERKAQEEREAVERERRAAEAREARLREEAEQAKRDAERRVRAAEEAARRKAEAEAEAEAKRKADAEHAALCKAQAAEAISQIIGEGPEAIVEAIVSGKIPRVSLRF